MGRLIRILAVLSALGLAARAGVLVENFDDIATLGSRGWVGINNSAPAGTTDWFQGNSGVFPAQDGAPDSYIAANWHNAAYGGNISNWGLTPAMWLFNGATISFWTRTENPAQFADRLELRLSVSGYSTDVGTTDSSVGDFGILLLTVNPGLLADGYPPEWTQVTATLSGLSSPAVGRFGFRYFVPDTSVNGDYIGIDTLVINSVPEPATWVVAGTGILGLAAFRRLRRKSGTLVGLVTVLALAAVTASAGDPKQAATQKGPAKQATAQTSQPASGGMRVAKDPVTGKIREPEADEIQALQKAAAPAKKLLRAPAVVTRPDGTRMIKLDERFMSYSVATRNPDGSISLECVQGGDAAKQRTHKSGEKEADDVR